MLILNTCLFYLHWCGGVLTDTQKKKKKTQDFFLCRFEYELIKAKRCIYASLNWVMVGSGNSLAPGGTKPLPEPMLTYEQASMKLSSKFKHYD